MSKNYLSKNDELFRGDYIMSNNGQWKAIFQDDGNFVIYGWKPTWEDCNLVMYSQCGTPRWHTNTYHQGSYITRLQLTDNGQLLVFKDAEELWTSANSRGNK